jgi:hypothetical protein
MGEFSITLDNKTDSLLISRTFKRAEPIAEGVRMQTDDLGAYTIEPNQPERRKPLPVYASGLLFFSVFDSVLSLLPLTNADMSMGWVCLLMPLYVIAILLWFVTAYYVTMPDCNPDPRVVRIFTLSTVLATIMLVVAISGVGFLARVWLSASYLEQFAKSVPPNSYVSNEDRWLGLFIVVRYESSEDGSVAITTAHSGMMNRAGVLYLPPGTSPPVRIRVKEHLFGPWYRFWREY